jgi:hypothetical protein
MMLDMQPGSPSRHGITLLWDALSREANTQMETHSHTVRTAVLDRWLFGVPGSEAKGESGVHSPCVW